MPLVDPKTVHLRKLNELSSNFGEDPASSLLKGNSIPIPVEGKELYDSKIGAEAAHIVFSALWELIGKISPEKQGTAISFLLREGSMFRGKSSRTLRRKQDQLTSGWNPGTLAEKVVDGYVVSLNTWIRTCAKIAAQRKAIGTTQSVFLRPIAQMSALACFLQELRKSESTTPWFTTEKVENILTLRKFLGKWMYGRFRLQGSEGELYPIALKLVSEEGKCEILNNTCSRKSEVHVVGTVAEKEKSLRSVSDRVS